jgi:hypothetical protein
MASVDEVIRELKKPRPEQIDEVARVVRDLSRAGCNTEPASLVEEAVEHGWPPELFTRLIGSMPELERSAPLAAN